MSGLTVRPGLMDIQPYEGGASTLPGRSRVVKLASNEGAFGPCPSAIEAGRRAVAEAHRYPDGACAALREALGRHHGLDPARIVCGAGSDEIIGLLARAYAGPGDEVLYSRHGFLMYAIAARAAGATPVWAAETDLTTDVDALLDKVTERTRIVFIANPNNPTGSYLPEAAVARLRDALPASVLLVLDAAYAEYITRNDYAPGISQVETGENVVMTRTFSKIYGLGGLRLGWAYCPPAVADVFNRARNPFNVSSAAQAAGLAALEEKAFTDAARRHNDVWLAWTSARLTALGLEVAPSVGNFVLVRFPRAPGRDAQAADAHLRSRGVIVRALGAYGLGDCLRLTVGTEAEMRLVADLLAEFVGR